MKSLPMQLRVSLLLSVVLATSARPSRDDCVDINNDKDNNDGWKYIEKLQGKTLDVDVENFNSTYKIGVCTNLLPNEKDAFAGVLEYTQDNQTIVVGRYNTSELISGGHWILLKYYDGDPYEHICSNSKRHAAIMFVCNHAVHKFEKATIIDENLGRAKDCYHLFEVEHCVACIKDGCNAFFHRYSPGTIILLGLVSLITVYLMFGWLFTRYIRKRRGWRQFPNVLFWKEIGHLQADGCNMVCRCGKRVEEEYHLISGDSNINNPRNESLFEEEDDENMLSP